MESNKIGPYDWKPFTEDEEAAFNEVHTKIVDPYIRMGPAGYVLPKKFLNHADDIRHFPLRPDDIFVMSFPRSGTTWTQELVWLLVNNLDFEKAKTVLLTERYQFLEFFCFFSPNAEFVKDDKDRKIWDAVLTPEVEKLNAMTSQRFIKTHLPLSMLPSETLDTTKVVYVARDMRDVVVSLYLFSKAFKNVGIQCDFKQYYWEAFTKDLVSWSPYFEHIREAWRQREHPNMLFIFYEELSKDLKATAKRVADFLGKHYTAEQFDKLCDHLCINKFKNNKAIQLDEHMGKMGIMESNTFIRRGKTGGWRDYFDEEMSQHAAQWMETELRGTGLTFQQ